MSEPVISIVIPVFNEAGNLSALVTQLELVLMKVVRLSYEIILVDDGSTDGSDEIIGRLAASNDKIFLIQFSRNFGHQYALKAGLDHARGEAVISMDADLQHPPELIIKFIEKWREGYDVVYSVRKPAAGQGFFKRTTSKLFYKIINRLSDIELEPGTADFRLLSRIVVDVLKDLNESELFLRGMVKWIGFNQTSLPYEPATRYAGKSKYTLKKMLRLALDGLTSFSIRPLYSATYLGLSFSLISVFFYVPYILFSVFSGSAVSGWASVMATVVFLGGLQLMMLGIIGIYLGKTFIQSKNRPNYIIKRISSDLSKAMPKA